MVLKKYIDLQKKRIMQVGEKAVTLLHNIKQSIQEIEPDAEVILFGSRARGNARQDSDWDILVLIPHPVTVALEQRFRHKLFELELEFGEAISTFVHSKEEWNNKYRVTPLYHSIKQEGIMI